MLITNIFTKLRNNDNDNDNDNNKNSSPQREPVSSLEVSSSLDLDARRSLEGLVVDGGKCLRVLSRVFRSPFHQHRLFARPATRRRRGGALDQTAVDHETPHILKGETSDQ